MPAPAKSIYRKPGAQHFQLVHRSQRDPLINDPEASQRVFKSIGRANDAQKTGYGANGVTLADLEATVPTADMRENEGEAALYGIHYDDSAYDYMSHLRTVGGGGGEGFSSVLLEAPKGAARATTLGKKGYKGKGKAAAEDHGWFPESVLPSKDELTTQEAYAAQTAIPIELQGLQPDMDPHLRQVLEALEDDAFVDEEAEDDGWFDELLGEGERDGEEVEEFPFAEWGVDEEPTEGEDGKGESAEPETWEERYAAFKKASKDKPVEPSEMDPNDPEAYEAADTIGSLNSKFGAMTVIGGKKRRGKRGASDASGYSMSSSSMFRNQGLSTLDERFDKIEAEYDDDDFPEDDEDYGGSQFDDSASMAGSTFSLSSSRSLYAPGRSGSSPPPIDREDFESIMDDFLDKYEVVGNRMQPVLGGFGLTGAEKLQILRANMLEEDSGAVDQAREELRRKIKDGEGRKEVKEPILMPTMMGDKKDKWDVETILSTYTNTENHPAMIRARSAAQAKAKAEAQAARVAEEEEDDEDDSGSETEREEDYRPAHVTVSRPKGETKEERKARKAAVKADRTSRRKEKKAHKDTFQTERKRQIATHTKTVADGRAADLNVAAKDRVGITRLH